MLNRIRRLEMPVQETENEEQEVKKREKKLKTELTSKEFEEMMMKWSQPLIKIFYSMAKNQEACLISTKKEIQESKLVQQKTAEKIELLEESLMMVMHNIKKNQFLYSHYPDDWVKDFLDVKKGMKFENDFMDKKIKGKDE